MKINKIHEAVVSGNYITPTDEYALMSLDIITKLYPIYENPIKTVDDAFLVASCLNYLNAYIKVPGSPYKKVFLSFYEKHPEIEDYLVRRSKEFNRDIIPYVQVRNKQDGYRCFKKLVVPLMVNIDNKFADDKNLICSPQQDAGSSLALIEIYGVQFSFHRVSIYANTSKGYYDKMLDRSTWTEWRGLKLQPLAMHTLNCALQLDNISEYYRNIINDYTNNDTKTISK